MGWRILRPRDTPRAHCRTLRACRRPASACRPSASRSTTWRRSADRPHEAQRSAARAHHRRMLTADRPRARAVRTESPWRVAGGASRQVRRSPPPPFGDDVEGAAERRGFLAFAVAQQRACGSRGGGEGGEGGGGGWGGGRKRRGQERGRRGRKRGVGVAEGGGGGGRACGFSFANSLPASTMKSAAEALRAALSAAGGLLAFLRAAQARSRAACHPRLARMVMSMRRSLTTPRAGRCRC